MFTNKNIIKRSNPLQNNLEDLCNDPLETLVEICRECHLSNSDLKHGLTHCDTILKSRANIIVDSNCEYFSKFNVFNHPLQFGRFAYKDDKDVHEIPSLGKDSLSQWRFYDKIRIDGDINFENIRKLKFGVYVPHDFVVRNPRYKSKDISYYAVGLSLYFDDCLRSDVCMDKMKDFIVWFSKSPYLRCLSIYVNEECFGSEITFTRFGALLGLFSGKVKFLTFYVSSKKDYNQLINVIYEDFGHIEGLILHADHGSEEVSLDYHVFKKFRKLRFLSVIGFLRCYEFISTIHKLPAIECVYIPLIIAKKICAMCNASIDGENTKGATIKNSTISGIGLGIFISSVKCVLTCMNGEDSIDSGILLIRNLANMERYFSKVRTKSSDVSNHSIIFCKKCLIAI
uniref:Zf-AD domain-containing protein n=1 Tax=Parastrongyloides trichosuri TaxID=131310 RepID=A0A0N4Z4R6_PARTI